MFDRGKDIFHSFRIWSPDMGMDGALFQMMCLVCTAVSLLVIIPSNMLQNLPPLVNLAVFIFGVCSFLLYVLARAGRELYGGLYLATLAAINVVWFFNGGSAGSVIYYFFSAFVYTMVFFRGSRLFLLMALLVADAEALFLLERIYPGAITSFVSERDHFIDLTTGFLSSGVTCILLTWAVVAGYRREREKLETANRELEQRLSEIKTLQGLLPICAWCKKIRDDEGLWSDVEMYIEAHTEADFSHSICPECVARISGDMVGGRVGRRS